MKRLEGLTRGPLRSGRPHPAPTTLYEIKALGVHIRRLEPEDLRVSKAQDAALDECLEDLELGEKIAAIEREIERLGRAHKRVGARAGT